MKSNSGIVFSFSPLNYQISKPSFECQFLIHPVKLLKDKYEKTVVHFYCWLCNYNDDNFLHCNQKRLPGSKTYKA